MFMLPFASMQAHVTANAGWVDYLIIGLYFVVTLGIGFVLRRRMRTSNDFFLSGRSLPSWVTGLAFVGANLGALEILGMGANAAQYGILQAHFYWIGAIPAMIFVAIFMMPFYYGSKTHSVPGFLKLRYNEATRGFNAITFGILTLLTSGINMYAAALVFNVLLGWSLDACIWLAALFIMTYILLGGLTSSIYNETLQFFLIVAGLFPLSIVGLINVGGWAGLQARVHNAAFFHLWAGTATNNNPFGVNFIGIVLGLGFVLSFGYWCTDFLVVQRALAAENQAAAERTPLIATFPKLFFPFLAIVPGLVILSVLPGLGHGGGFENSYNMAIPFAMAHYFPSGILGLGLTALLAAFMSGMAGNVTAFNTVWTYDIYRSYIKRDAPDRHYLWMGRIITVVGIILSVGTAYRRRVQQYYGLCPGLVLRGQCPTAGDLPAWHVLETHDTVGWLHRVAHWYVVLPVSLGGGTIFPSVLLREFRGLQYVARADRLSHLFCGDHRRLTLDQTQARCRTQRAGLQFNAKGRSR